MEDEIITLRMANTDDLPTINNIIDDAVMSWDLPERVKRLSLPSYHYHAYDLDNLEMMVAIDNSQQLVGVAAWEQAESADVPAGKHALLLHGLYVDTNHQRQSIGHTMLQAVERYAEKQGYDGLLVKAQASAAGFFKAQGMEALKVENENRDYAHRYWKLITGSQET